MSKKEKSKEYAESIPQFDDRKRFCIEDFCSGWHAAMEYLYRLPLDKMVEEIVKEMNNK